MTTLTREQQAAVACEAHALALHAGAGAGKTLTLAHRVARFGRTPHAQSRLLVVTFTRDATASLQRKLSLILGRNHMVQVRSFHQWAARELPPHARRFLDEKDARRILLDALGREDALRRALGSTREEAAARLAGLAGYVKNRGATVADVVAGPCPNLAPHEDALQRAIDAYEDRKGDALDFDDVPLAFHALLRSRSARAEIASRLDHVFVDEYQDVNAAQAGAVRDLTSPKYGPRVTVVGDPRQAIYAFRGSSPEHLETFPEAYGRRARVLALTANFRASRNLVRAANAIEPARPMRGTRATREGAPPEVVACADGEEEARVVVDHAERLLRKAADPSEIVVLCRTRRLGQPTAYELARRAAASPESGFDRIGVRTIHAAKGLEWDHVVLVGAREGGLPGEPALLAGEKARAELLAEERRLAYVALTRARRSFVATWAREGRAAPSRFFAFLDRSVGQNPLPVPRATSRA